MRRTAIVCVCALLATSSSAIGQSVGTQSPKPVAAPSDSRPAAPDSVTLRIVNTELRAAVQIIQEYLDKPVIFTGVGAGAGPQVTLESPRPVSRSDVPRLLRGLLDAQGYELVDDTASGTYRARPKDQARPAAPPTFGASSQAATAPRQQGGAPQLFVIALKHARAADVANTINALFGRTSAQQFGAPVNRTPTLSDELRSNQVPPAEASPLPQSIPGTAGRVATITGDLTIVPDSRGNSLLIRANRSDFELIQAAVAQIDVRPPQVLIEVVIVEARRDRSFSLGIEASIADKHVKELVQAFLQDEDVAHVLGFVNQDRLGLYGVEGWYNDVLTPTRQSDGTFAPGADIVKSPGLFDRHSQGQRKARGVRQTKR